MTDSLGNGTRPDAGGDPLVHAIGWFDGRYGYNVHTRNVFDSLSRLLPTVASPMIGRDGPIEADRAALAAFRGRRIASVALLPGDLMHVLDGAPGLRIGYTVWESTRLPPNWIEPLARLDRIWIPSAWGRQVLIDNGLPAERIDVVPEGVDPALFHPGAAPAAAIAAMPGFKFLCVGKFEPRKASRELLAAFDREFADTPDVKLVMACDNPFDRSFDLGRELRALNLRHPEKLVFVPPVRRQESLAGLYTACDAFVLPTRAEGWGLPVIEAMACGLPVIAPYYSGLTEYVGEFILRLDFRIVPIRESLFESPTGDYGEWADPDIHHLQTLMRTIYDDKESARRLGEAASQHVRSCFSWDQAARRAASIIRRTGETNHSLGRAGKVVSKP